MIIYNRKKLKVLQCTDSRLREGSADVKDFDKTVADFAHDLTKMMRDPLNDGVATVGISAVQVGYNIKLCVCNNPVNNKNITMINPEIIEASTDMSQELEGCISVGTGANQLFAYVPRPKKVKFRFFNLKGEEVEMDANGLFSHIVQHEIDHMFGKLFIDYISDPNEIMTLAELNESHSSKTAHLNAI